MKNRNSLRSPYPCPTLQGHATRQGQTRMEKTKWQVQANYNIFLWWDTPGTRQGDFHILKAFPE